MSKGTTNGDEGDDVTLGPRTRVGIRWFMAGIGLIVGAQFWGHEQVDSIKGNIAGLEKSVDKLTAHVEKLDELMHDGVRQAEFSAFKRDVRNWVELYRARNPTLDREGLIPEFRDR